MRAGGYSADAVLGRVLEGMSAEVPDRISSFGAELPCARTWFMLVERGGDQKKLHACA